MSEIRECKVGDIIRIGDSRFITCGYGFKREIPKQPIDKIEPKMILVNYDTYKFSGKVDIWDYPIIHKLEGEVDIKTAKIIIKKFIIKKYNFFNSSNECEKWLKEFKIYLATKERIQKNSVYGVI